MTLLNLHTREKSVKTFNVTLSSFISLPYRSVYKDVYDTLGRTTSHLHRDAFRARHHYRLSNLRLAAGVIFPVFPMLFIVSVRYLWIRHRVLM